MLHAGISIAPFLGFLQERCALISQDCHLGFSLLFFGCQRRDDLLFVKELQHAVDMQALSNLQVIFSREVDHFLPEISSRNSSISQIFYISFMQHKKQKNKYVQDMMVKHGARLWELLYDQRGYLYIAG